MPNLIYVGVDADSFKLPTGTYIVKEQNKTKKKRGFYFKEVGVKPFFTAFASILNSVSFMAPKTSR